MILKIFFPMILFSQQNEQNITDADFLLRQFNAVNDVNIFKINNLIIFSLMYF